MKNIIVFLLFTLSISAFAQNIEGLWVANLDTSKTCTSHGEAQTDVLSLVRIKKVEGNKYSVGSSWKCFGYSEVLASLENGKLTFVDDFANLEMKVTDTSMEGSRKIDLNGAKSETKILNAVKISTKHDGIKVRKDKVNKYVSFSNYYIKYNNCTYLATVTDGKTQQVSFIVTKNLERGRIPFKGLSVCETNPIDYAVVFSALWDQVTYDFLTKKGIKIGEFALGVVKRNPLEKEWSEKLSYQSSQDADFKTILKEGEKKITLNHVATRILKEFKLDENFLKVHKRIGMFLEFDRVEKVFRDKVKKLPYKAELVKQGLKDNDTVISGVGIYYYRIK